MKICLRPQACQRGMSGTPGQHSTVGDRGREVDMHGEGGMGTVYFAVI